LHRLGLNKFLLTTRNHSNKFLLKNFGAFTKKLKQFWHCYERYVLLFLFIQVSTISDDYVCEYVFQKLRILWMYMVAQHVLKSTCWLPFSILNHDSLWAWSFVSGRRNTYMIHAHTSSPSSRSSRGWLALSFDDSFDEEGRAGLSTIPRDANHTAIFLGRRALHCAGTKNWCGDGSASFGTRMMVRVGNYHSNRPSFGHLMAIWLKWWRRMWCLREALSVKLDRFSPTLFTWKNKWTHIV
jgi:hypothetical protein